MSEKEIIAMYRKGFGADRIADALGTYRAKVYRVLKKHKIPRRSSGSYQPVREWRKLTRKGKSKRMRQVVIPVRLIEKAGFDPDEELEGKWEAKGGHLVLYMREVE